MMGEMTMLRGFVRWNRIERLGECRFEVSYSGNWDSGVEGWVRGSFDREGPENFVQDVSMPIRSDDKRQATKSLQIPP